ncbi:MAG: N-acetylmuramic acid 6-phosphate etherase [Planctomycetota bacterium]|nr:MAG: N-acetylmuramic acid 6-phosphate etherase [Planctomycetota bacterium]
MRESHEAAALPVTEAEHPACPPLDRMGALELVRLLAEEERRSPAAVAAAAEQIAAIAELAAAALTAGGALVLCGAGTSGRLALAEAAECPPTFGSAPEQVRAIMAGGPAAMVRAVEGAEDDASAGARAVAAERLGSLDVLVGISASGGAPFVRGALAEARRRGARTALLTCNPALAAERPPPAEVVAVLAVGPEVLAGSTRLKGGTATKIALNAITTAAFALAGKVYGDLMVDLQASNAKLRARARRLVMRLGGVEAARAEELLAQADWRVKEAVVMARRGLGAEQAREVLAAVQGRLRQALEGS